MAKSASNSEDLSDTNKRNIALGFTQILWTEVGRWTEHGPETRGAGAVPIVSTVAVSHGIV